MSEGQSQPTARAAARETPLRATGAARLLRRIAAVLIFLTLFVGVLGSAHYYLLKRIALDVAWPDAVAPVLIAFMVTGLGTLMVHGLLWRQLGVIAKPMSWVAYVWLGVLFYLFVATAGLDLATLLYGWIGDPQAAHTTSDGFLRARAALIVLLALSASALATRRGLAPPTTKRVSIELENFPEALNGFRIVQISDIHIGPMLDRRFAAHLRDRVAELEPDLIAVTGDLVDGQLSHLADEVEPFSALRAPHGVYFVTGNHDYYSGAHDWTEHVASFGWRPLRNSSTTIERDGASFTLAGVDDPHGAILTGEGGEDLAAALRHVDESQAIVLLAHDPATFRRARTTRVGLQISGHTHGGQIWPFGWAVRASTRWVAGHYRAGKAQIYVSCGTGFWGPPMRLGTEAEITEITLRRANA